jgi:integrase
MKLLTFFREKYKPLRLLGRSANTTRLYEISIRNFGRTLQHEPTLDDLTDMNVVKHMQAMLDAGRTAATANKDRAQLLTLWRQAHRTGLVGLYPEVPQLPEPIRTPDAWLPEDIDRLLAATDKQVGHFGSVPRSLWWRSLILLALDTGERIGALRQASWDWFRGEWFNVPAEARKGGRRDRAYRLGSDTLGHLQAIRFVSPPEQKAEPAPVRSTQPTPGSAPSAGMHCASACFISSVSALRASGRFSVTRATPSAWSNRMWW